jgi:hypothetical protein
VRLIDQLVLVKLAWTELRSKGLHKSGRITLTEQHNDKQLTIQTNRHQIKYNLVSPTYNPKPNCENDDVWKCYNFKSN